MTLDRRLLPLAFMVALSSDFVRCGPSSSSAAAPVSDSVAVAVSKCNDQQFDCQDGEGDGCVALDWVCDNVKDCRNGRDEASCNYRSECKSKELLCLNLYCVAAEFKCNGFDDCGDASDERGCPVVEAAVQQQPSVCPPGLFKCWLGPCISIHARCDGMTVG